MHATSNREQRDGGMKGDGKAGEMSQATGPGGEMNEKGEETGSLRLQAVTVSLSLL